MPVFTKQKLCFIHIPKTAGTSIFEYIKTNEPEGTELLHTLYLFIYSYFLV